MRTALPCIDSAFFNQARLADPRLANERHQRRLPAESGIDCGAQRGHLLGTADEPSPGQASRGGRQPEVFGLTCCGRRAEFSCRPRFFAARRPFGELPVRSDA
jgi:hypothetical protein